MPHLHDILLVTTILLVAMAPMTASFLQCWADRARAGMTGVPDGRSRCDACGTPLRALDLVPILSWLTSRGRSRCCETRLSPALLWPEVAAFSLALWGALIAPPLLSVPTVALVWLLQTIVLLNPLRPDVARVMVGVLIILGLALSITGLTGAFWTHAAGLGIGLALIAASRIAAPLRRFSDAIMLLAASGALLGAIPLFFSALAGAALTPLYWRLVPILGLPKPNWPHAALVSLAAGLWLTWLYTVAV